MCFKRKKIEVVEGKFSLGELVSFKNKGEVTHGYIYAIKKNEVDEVVYDIQIGGECPAIIRDIKENEIIKR